MVVGTTTQCLGGNQDFFVVLLLILTTYIMHHGAGMALVGVNDNIIKSATTVTAIIDA